MGPKEPSRSPNVPTALGLLESSKYKELLREEDPDVSGYLGWVWLEVGYAFWVNPHLQVTPRLALLGGSVETTISGFEGAPNRDANIVVLTGLAARYYLSLNRNSFFGGVSVSHVYPHFNTFSGLESESDGISFGAAVGYAFSNIEIEMQFLKVPVRDVIVPQYSSSREPGAFDAGGIGVTVRVYL